MQYYLEIGSDQNIYVPFWQIYSVILLTVMTSIKKYYFPRKPDFWKATSFGCMGGGAREADLGEIWYNYAQSVKKSVFKSLGIFKNSFTCTYFLSSAQNSSIVSL